MQQNFPQSEYQEFGLDEAKRVAFNVINHKKPQGEERLWKIYWDYNQEPLSAAMFALAGMFLVSALLLLLLISLQPFWGIALMICGFSFIVTIILMRLAYLYEEYRLRERRNFCVVTSEGIVVYEAKEVRYFAFTSVDEILLSPDVLRTGTLCLMRGDIRFDFSFPSSCCVDFEYIEQQYAVRKDKSEKTAKPKEEKDQIWSPEGHLYRPE